MQPPLGLGIGSLLLGGSLLAIDLPKPLDDGPEVQRVLLYTVGNPGKEVIVQFTQFADGTSQTRKVTSEASGRWFNPKLSPDGMTVLATRQQGDARKVVMFPLTEPLQVTVLNTPDTEVAEDPSWSPDGTRFVYKRTYRHSPYSGEIIEVNKDGSNPNIITTAAVFDGREASIPSYSQSDGGRRIVFQSFIPDGPGKEPHEQIFVVSRTSKAVKQLTYGPGKHWYPAWSPLGESVVYVKGDIGGPARLWRVEAGTKAESVVTVPDQDGISATTDLVDPTFSPAGWLAFSARINRTKGTYKLFDFNPSFTRLALLTPTATVGLYGANYAVSPVVNLDAPVYSWTGAKGGNFVSPSFNAMEGDRFKIVGGKNVVVTALGYEYHSATQPTATVAVYDESGKLIARTDVAATDTLVNGYYYKDIPPLTLQAGKSYYIGGLHFTGNAWSYYHNTAVAKFPAFIGDEGTYYRVTSDVNQGQWAQSGPRHYLANFMAHQAP